MSICSKLRRKLKNIRHKNGETSGHLKAGSEGQNIERVESVDLERARRLLEEENDETQSNIQQRDIEELIVHLKKGLKKMPLFWSSGERLRQGELLSSLGHAHYKLCKFNIARNYYERYFKCIKNVNSPICLQRAHCNLGCVFRRLGDFDKAIEFLEKGLEISEELEDLRSQSRLLNNLGNIYEVKGDFETALEYYLRRRRLAGVLQDGDGRAKAHASLGNAYHCLGDIRRSIGFYEKMIVWLRKKLGAPKKKKGNGCTASFGRGTMGMMQKNNDSTVNNNINGDEQQQQQQQQQQQE